MNQSDASVQSDTVLENNEPAIGDLTFECQVSEDAPKYHIEEPP